MSNKRLSVWNLAWNNSIKYKNIYIPNYLSKIDILRICGNYYRYTKKIATYHIFQLILEDVFKKIKKKEEIKNFNLLEFGAGSGSNLIFLKKKKIINKKLLAFDWSIRSLKLIKKNAKNNKVLIETHKFNIKNPVLPKLNCSADIVLTFHAMEQVFTSYKKFLKIINKLKPKYIVNVEPIMENYNIREKHDLLAYKYHLSRKYLHNYKSYLKSLQDKSKVNIIFDRKYYFGNKYDDSSSVLIWKFK